MQSFNNKCTCCIRKKTYIFAIHYFIAVIIILPFILKNGGILTMCEDFNAETIPYLYFIHDSIYAGDFGWNYFFDLGGDAVQSLSSIGAFNPTTLLNALLPRNIIIYALPWFVMLRYALMGLGAFVYIKRYVRKESSAFIGSLVYAFSGFSACMLVFNFINDAFIIFPFVLWSLDELVLENHRGVFAIFIFITALSSPSTLVMEVFFLAIYFFIHFLIENLQYIRKILECVWEGFLGIGMALISFGTQLFILTGSSRLTNDSLLGKDALSFSSINIMLWLRALVLPGETMSNSSSIVGTDWTGNAAYLPMIGITLALAYFLKKEKDWITRILAAELVISLIPCLNNMFMLEMAYPYRRWYAFGLLIMALASARVLDETQKYKIKESGFIALMLILGYWFVVNFVKWDENGSLPVYSAFRFKIRIMVAVIGVICTILLSCKYVQNSKVIAIKTTICVILFAVLCNCMMLSEYKGDSAHAIEENQTYQVLNELQYPANVLHNKEILPYRIAFNNNYYNYGMMYYLPSRMSFISLVSGSISKFYQELGTPRTTNSPWGPNGTNTLVSTRYYVMLNKNRNLNLIEKKNNGNKDIYLYEDTSALPIGFTYDSYMTSEELNSVPLENKAYAALSTLIVSEKDVDEVKELLPHTDMDFVENEVTEKKIQKQKLNRREESSTDFQYSTTSFNTKIKTTGNRYAFFSIPYNKQWSATVNENDVKIIDSIGMMAIPLEEGLNEIQFSYHAYLSKSMAVGSIIFMMIWFIYVKLNKRKRRGNV